MKLGMEMKQIKFWFQNHRTQMKTQLKRHENILLRNQNDELIAENVVLRKNVTEPRCTSCGGPMLPTPLAFENEQLRAENALLKDEVGRLCALTNRYNRPIISPSATTLAPTAPTLSENKNQNHINRNPGGPNLGSNNNCNHNNTKTNTTTSNINPASLGIGSPTKTRRPVVLSNSGYNWEVYKQYVHRATTEVMSMTHTGEPLWVKKSGEEEVESQVLSPRVGAWPCGE
ncbi:Homeobox-leucine zipper protein ROC4 [Linum perenne]